MSIASGIGTTASGIGTTASGIGTTTLTSLIMAACDIDQDKKITSIDALMILQVAEGKACSNYIPTPTPISGQSCKYSSDSNKDWKDGEKLCLNSNGTCAICKNRVIFSSTGCSSSCKNAAGPTQDKVIECENAYSKYECSCNDSSNIRRNHGDSWCNDGNLIKCVVGEKRTISCGNAGCNLTTKTCNTISLTPTLSPKINGVCGSADNTTVSSIPTTNLCKSGTLEWYDKIASDGQYNWTCRGNGNGASDAGCGTQLNKVNNPCTEANWKSILSPKKCPSSGKQVKVWLVPINCDRNAVGAVNHKPIVERVNCN